MLSILHLDALSNIKKLKAIKYRYKEKDYMKKLTQRQKQAIKTKLNILDIATRLAKTSSFEAITVKDICDTAGISVGAFYHHFKSKNDIITTGYKQLDLLLSERYDVSKYVTIPDKIKGLFGEGGDLLQELGVSIVIEAYRNQLLSPAEYSFSHERSVYLEVKECLLEAHSQGMINEEISQSIDYIADKIMKIVRGTIFDWCLNKGQYRLRTQIEEDLGYFFKVLFNKSTFIHHF